MVADDVPSGARYFRCALQVNSSTYASTFQGRRSYDSPAAYAKAMIERARELGVSAIALTDHNSVAEIPFFREAASETEIVIFPGFELASSEGIHVLCIYAPETKQEQLKLYLGGLGIENVEPSSDLSTKSFADILRQVTEQGGVTIAAHVTQANGLLQVLDGQVRVNAWLNPHLRAIQIPGPIAELPDNMRLIVENKEQRYAREHPAGERQAVAVVNAKDVGAPEDLSDKSATCWIKMSELSIEGLRQAFLDPDSRIRLNSSAPPEPYASLLSLEWEGGFLDGTAVSYTPLTLPTIA